MLQTLKEKKLKRTSQLFIICLIAYYNERQRSRGKISGLNIDKKEAIYRVTLSDEEIRRKFKFSIDTLISTKRDLKKKNILIIKFIGIVSERKKYKHFKFYTWGKKYQNYEEEYILKVFRDGRRIIDIPTKVIYDKNLSYSEKLSIVWNLSLREKLGRQPKLKEIEKESGISERTIRKAKKKYPRLFMK